MVLSCTSGVDFALGTETRHIWTFYVTIPHQNDKVDEIETEVCNDIENTRRWCSHMIVDMHATARHVCGPCTGPNLSHLAIAGELHFCLGDDVESQRCCDQNFLT